MLLLITSCILTGIFAIIIRLSLWRKNVSKQLTGRKPIFFDIFGDMKEFLIYDTSPDKYFLKKNYLDVFRRRTEEFRKQKMFCLWITYVPFVCLIKAEAVKELLIEKRMLEKCLLYKWLKPVLGSGLITSDVAKWKLQKKLLMPCFHSEILRGFLSVFNENSRKLVEVFKREVTEEFSFIEDKVGLTTLDIICETMFGVKIGALENGNSEIFYSFRRITEIYTLRVFESWRGPDFVFRFSKLGKELEYHMEVVRKCTRKIIQEKKKKYLSGEKKEYSGKHKALLDMLLERHIEANEISEEEIFEQVNTFILAGNETASTSIIWALFLIGLYPDVQEKIHEELDRIFGENSNSPVLEEDLSKLQYLECVLKETNRLYPPVPQFGRNIPEDTNICGNIIPKGTSCIIFTYFLHRDEEVFPDPEKFDPDRFSKENSFKIPDLAYIPFAAGPRNCIGQRFALMEIKTLMSSILRNFSIESLDSRDKISPFMHITLCPSSPIRIRIRPRKTQNSC